MDIIFWAVMISLAVFTAGMLAYGIYIIYEEYKENKNEN